MKFFYNDEETGPFSASEMRDLCATGTIKPETPVFREGDSEWREFRHFPELVVA